MAHAHILGNCCAVDELSGSVVAAGLLLYAANALWESARRDKEALRREHQHAKRALSDESTSYSAERQDSDEASPRR